jgi:hypothetical protein
MAQKRIWSRKDFDLDARGVVRLGSGTAREMAGLALKSVTAAKAGESVRRLAGWL